MNLPEKQEESITDYLKQMKFRRKIFGGVDERDVWQKIEQLNELYKQALFAERVRYDTLLQERGDAR